MEITFCELKSKQVVNVIDGKQLGHIVDLVINSNCAKIVGLIVPGTKSGINFFKSTENLFIPYQNICKIGEDVILVEVYSQNARVKGLNVPNYENTEVSNGSINIEAQTIKPDNN